MLYTVGETEKYEQYIKEQGTISKAVGGSVWSSKEAAQKYLKERGLLGKFTVYGIDAGWNDTEYTGNPWRDLKIVAKIIEL